MKKEFTKFETLVYFTGATAVLLSFLVLEALSMTFDFWQLLIITIVFIGIDILYFVTYRREKHAEKKQ